VVLGGLAGFVVTTYVVVVLGVGALVGRTDSPDLTLSVVATAVVALGFEPVQRRLDQVARRLVDGGTPSPYDVLSRFSETVTGGYTTEELPARMATVLGEGTGAEWSQVWLTVQDRLTLAATWPPDAAAGATSPVPSVPSEPPEPVDDARDATGEGRRALPVRHGGQVLGVFRLQERPDQPLTTVEERLFSGLAAQAGLVLRLVGLRAELAARHDELVVRADELRASRERLIETQDAERRRLERDIHDGAQQHLVALAVNLRLAETVATRSPERAARVLADQAVAAREAIETLSRLSRGIYPRLLADEGLVPALRAAVATSPVPVTVEADDLAGASGASGASGPSGASGAARAAAAGADPGAPGRPPTGVEAALYFFAMEAVQNAAKHASASAVTVRLTLAGDGPDARWRLSVTDDGTGFDAAGAEAAGGGAGLSNMRDRLDAVGGSAHLVSRPGHGTTVVAEVPVGAGAAALPGPRPVAAP
jgi:signal transduction histidine kinase